MIFVKGGVTTMKKIIVGVLAAVMLLSTVLLTGCGGYTVKPIKSKIFEDEAYQAAVDQMMIDFSEFEGCTMKEVSYAGDDVVYAEAEAAGVNPDCLIVLKTTFETDGEDHQNGLEPNFTYEDFTWTYTRTDFTMPWEHKDHGYG